MSVLPVSITTEDRAREAAQRALGNLTKEQVRELFGRKTPFLEDLYIRDKDKNLIPFVLNETQSAYRDLIKPNWRDKPYELEGLREFNLKGRQFGLSTYVLAEFFINTLVHPRTYTMIIAQEAETTERLFDIIERFWDNLDEFYKPRYPKDYYDKSKAGKIEVKPKYSTRKELTWQSLDSTIFVGKAGSTGSGRSSTINNVLCTEVPNWPDAETLMTGLKNSVPKRGNIFIESTAEGYGNWFQEEWDRTNKFDEVGNRLSNYTPRFWSWANVPEYQATEVETRLNFEKRTRLQQEEEDKLQKFYDLTDEQIVWRREKIRDLGSLGKFQQEFPLNPDEAFLATGSPYFDRDYLKELRDRLQSSDYDPIFYDHLRFPDFDQINELYTKMEKLYENRKFLSIWFEPQPFRQYIISADPAEGINEWGDHDYCCADIYDVETWNQVGQLYGRWEPFDFGLLLADLGYWYNNAVIGIERNNHGHAVISSCLHNGEYPVMQDGNSIEGLYLHEEYDQIKDMAHRLLGYPATPKNKIQGLARLKRSMDDKDIKINSRVTVQEMFRFVKKIGGKYGGEGKTHDDTVSAASIGVMLLTQRQTVAAHAPVAGQPSNSNLLANGLGIQTLENLLGITAKNYNTPYKPPI